MFEWGIENYGGKVHIWSSFTGYTEIPTETLLTIDIETDEEDRIVCVGVTGNGTDVYVYFNPSPEFFEWLRTKQLVGHDLAHAEIPWLKKYGFSMANAYMDTKIMSYVENSARKDWGLKSLVKDVFGAEYPTYKEMVGKGKAKLTLDKQPIETVAQYNAADVFWTHKLFHHYNRVMTAQQKQFLNKLEWETTKLLYEMESKGILIDTKEVRRIHNANSKLRRANKRALIQCAGKSFNPNSPKQVLPLLQQAGAKVTKTDEDTIKRFSSIPFVSCLLEYRGYNKLCSTYTIPLYTEAIKAVDGRIRARFGQNTVTGRLSSSDPINLQNQPETVRSAFIAGEGKRFVGCDFTNIELFLPAHFSGEPGFIRTLASGGDLHMETAQRIFGADLLSRPAAEVAEKRKIAKTCNFLLTNSGSAKRLAVELNVGQKEAEGIYKKFWEGYPVLAAWLKETKRKAAKDGGVQTMFGRFVSLPQLKLWCGRSSCPVFAPNGYFCKECFIREETEREAVSIKVQGSAADIMKLAALRLYREYKYVPEALIHDEYLASFKEEEAGIAAHRIKQTMESVISLTVPLRAKAKIGRSWKDVH